MTGRRIYALIIRLHPLQFRQRFGEELLATFDDAVEDRGWLPLFVDALVSLLRQWLLRSKLRTDTERAYRRVQYLNFLWFTVCFLIWATVLPSRPSERFFDSFILFVLMSGLLNYWTGSPISLLSRIYLSPIRLSRLFKRSDSSGNTTRNPSEKKRDQLRSFNPSFGVILMLFRLSRPQPWTQFLISLVLFTAASSLGLFVRRANRELADRIAGEVPTE